MTVNCFDPTACDVASVSLASLLRLDHDAHFWLSQIGSKWTVCDGLKITCDRLKITCLGRGMFPGVACVVLVLCLHCGVLVLLVLCLCCLCCAHLR
jgi:hypothetical protein